MRVSIIVPDNVVSIDGAVTEYADLSSLSADIHAIQWYGTYGEIERKDLQTGLLIANEPMSDTTLIDSIVLDAQAKLASPSATPAAAQAINNTAMWAQVQQEKAIAAALVKFGVLATDPTIIPVSAP